MTQPGNVDDGRTTNSAGGRGPTAATGASGDDNSVLETSMLDDSLGRASVTVTEAVTQDGEHFVDRASIPFAVRLIRNDLAAWGIALLAWSLFFAIPILASVIAGAALNRIEGGVDSVWWWIAALGGVQVGRFVLLGTAIVQWYGGWVFWQTVPRVNMLRSLLTDPGPVTGRLPGSPGEAVSRFRDDVRDVANVVDVALDVVAASITAVGLTVLLMAIDVQAGLVMLAPVLAVMGIGHALGSHLRDWRWDERRRTAQVTDFLGDIFGGVSAVKVAGAEAAAVDRFDQLSERRAEAARRDQVGTQLVPLLSGFTANAGVGLALVVVAGPLRAQRLNIGDIAIFTMAATALAGLPRIVGRYSVWRRQADVSVARMARLVPGNRAATVAAPTATWLRHGPPTFVRQRVDGDSAPGPNPGRHSNRLERLDLVGVTVTFDDKTELVAPDMSVEHGQLVVVTGEVGVGKSLLVRALLGLVPAEGEIRWNGREVTDPSMFMVPPRVAYVPQLPRLFSESLSDTILLGIDEAGLSDALFLAVLDGDVEDLPDGVDTLVGSRGVRLSGGQIQRAAAARAFVRHPQLLVVDDLSSALDATTETAIWDRLTQKQEGRTVLAVSHRQRVIEAADQVITITR